MIRQLLEEYSNQYPEADPITSLIYQFGEEGAIEILKNRKGQQIKIKRDTEAPDYLDYEYI